MKELDWQTFLERWSAVALQAPSAVERFPPAVVASGWLGYPGATDEQIARAEARLRITLPPSYRAFLKVSNGWRLANDVIDVLWSTEELEWFAVRHSDWVDIWMEDVEMDALVSDADFFVYGSEQDETTLRRAYLRTALEISTDQPDTSSIYLLNPQVVTPQGEWEAWYFANWLPGARRHPSFQDLMLAEFERIVR